MREDRESSSELGEAASQPIIKDSEVRDPDLSPEQIEAAKKLVDGKNEREDAERSQITDQFRRTNEELSGANHAHPNQSSEKVMKLMIKLNKGISEKETEIKEAKSSLDSASSWSFLHKADLQRKIQAFENQITALRQQRAEAQSTYNAARETEKKMMSEKKAGLEARGFNIKG